MIPPQYIDKFGLPGCIQDNGELDMGDSCAIMANAVICQGADPLRMNDFWANGYPARHVDPSRWWGRPGRFSRDQMIAAMCAMVLYQTLNEFAHALWNWHKKRWFLYTDNRIKNGVELDKPHKLFADFTGPEVWALWIRVWNIKWAWPILCLLDGECLLSAIHWRFWRRDRVARNHLLVLKVCNEVMPTPTMRLARWITPVDELKAKWKAHCEAVREPYLFEGTIN